MYILLTLIVLLSLCNSQKINENDYRFIDLFFFKENVFQRENMLEFISLNRDFNKQPIKDRTYILHFQQPESNSSETFELAQKMLFNVLLYLQTYDVHLGLVNCSEKSIRICKGKSGDSLYYPFKKDSQLNAISLIDIEDFSIENEVFHIMESTLGETHFVFYTLLEEKHFLERMLNTDRKVPFMILSRDLYKSAHLAFLEVAHKLKSIVISGVAEIRDSSQKQADPTLIPYVRVFDPRRCTADSSDDCITLRVGKEELDSFRPLVVACSIVRSFVGNATWLDVRKFSHDNNPVPRFVLSIVKQCPHVVFVVYPTDHESPTSEHNLDELAAHVNATFAPGLPGFVGLQILQDQLFNILNNVDSDILNSDLIYHSAVKMEVKKYSGSILDLKEITSFVKDQIAVTSSERSPLNRPLGSLLFSEPIHRSMFYVYKEGRIGLHLSPAVEAQLQKELQLTSVDDFRQQLKDRSVLGVLFTVSWSRPCLSALEHLLEAHHHLQDHTGPACSSGCYGEHFALATVDCFEENLICEEAGVVRYPSFVFFHSDAGSGEERNRTVEEDLSLGVMVRSAFLHSKPPVVEATSSNQVITAVQEVFSPAQSTPSRPVMFGVNLNQDNQVSDLFHQTADFFRGKQLFLSTSFYNLPSNIQSQLSDKSSKAFIASLNPLSSTSPPRVYSGLLTRPELEPFVRISKLSPFFELVGSNFFELSKIPLPFLVLFVHDLSTKHAQLLAGLSDTFQDRYIVCWMSLDRPVSQTLFTTYGCDQTPCFVSVNKKKGEAHIYGTSSLMIARVIVDWIESILTGTLEPEYTFTSDKFQPPGPAKDYVPLMYPSSQDKIKEPEDSTTMVYDLDTNEVPEDVTGDISVDHDEL